MISADATLTFFYYLLLALPGMAMTLPVVVVVGSIKKPTAVAAALGWPVAYGLGINFDHTHNWEAIKFPAPSLNFASAPLPWLGAIPSFVVAVILAIRLARTI